MNNEIKEILKKLLEYFKESNINDFGYEKDKLISYEEAQIILDYITNLQEENKHLDEVNCKLRKVGETLKDTNKLLLQQKGQLQEDLDMLDKRIDKAIEYIKSYNIDFENTKFGEAPLNINDLQKLLNILQGEYKE